LDHRVEGVTDLVHQARERLTVVPTGLLEEVSIHLDLRTCPGSHDPDHSL